MSPTYEAFIDLENIDVFRKPVFSLPRAHNSIEPTFAALLDIFFPKGVSNLSPRRGTSMLKFLEASVNENPKSNYSTSISFLRYFYFPGVGQTTGEVRSLEQAHGATFLFYRKRKQNESRSVRVSLEKHIFHRSSVHQRR